MRSSVSETDGIPVGRDLASFGDYAPERRRLLNLLTPAQPTTHPSSRHYSAGTRERRPRRRLVLVELSVVERRYHAVMEVLAAGASKTEVAARYQVSRQSVHSGVRRYEQGGPPALADRSHRPRSHP